MSSSAVFEGHRACGRGPVAPAAQAVAATLDRAFSPGISARHAAGIDTRTVLARLAGQAVPPVGEGEQSAYFGPAHRPLFGCYHPPVQGVVPRDLAVLLCGPHGAEEVSAHRSLRALAQGLAGDGLPVLRFDLDGCGDSAGDDLDPARVPAWLASIDAALEALRLASGCTRLAVVGVQLGALLTAQVLRRHPGLVAWLGVAPTLSGRQFLRERLALGALHASPQDPAAPPLLEAGGVAYTQATREALGVLQLDAAAQAGPGTRLIVFQREELPLPRQVCTALGPRLTLRGFTGYADMMLEPHWTRVPRALCEDLRACLRGLAAPRHAGVDASRFGRATAHWDGVVERPVRVGSQGLAGVLSLPGTGRSVRRTLLILNAGAVRRIGPGRLHAGLARRWAARGVAVLRLDLSGLGDSAARPGQADNVVYGAHAVAEAVEAAKWLAAVTGIARGQVLGLCAGAYHALQAAAAGAPVARVFALNPLTFHHAPGTALRRDGVGAHALHAVGAALGKGWRDPVLWQRLWRGQLPCRTVLQRVLGFALARLNQRWTLARYALARAIGRPRPGDVVQLLQDIARQGACLHFVFGEGEPGPALLRQQAGSCVQRLRELGLLTHHALREVDHTFSLGAARERLAQRLDALVLPAPQPIAAPMAKAQAAVHEEAVLS